MPPNPNRVTPEQAARNAAQITALWVWGVDSVKRCPAGSFKYRETLDRQREEVARLKERQRVDKKPLLLGLNLDSFAKMRRIATLYTKEQIEHLAGQVRHHESRFSTSHLMRSLAVADPKVRNSLVARAVRESCTLSEFERRVQVARGARRSGAGRKPFVPTEPEQRLVLLEGLVLKWLRWTKLAAPKLPADIGKLVGAVDTKIEALRKGLHRHPPRAGQGGNHTTETDATGSPAGRRPR